MVHQLARDDFAGRLLDGLSELGMQSVRHVDGGGRPLQDTEGLDDRRGHSVKRLVDLEVGERPSYSCQPFSESPATRLPYR